MGRGWPTSGEDLISGLRIRSGPGACCCSCWIDSQADVRLSSRACRPPVRWCGRGRERTGKEGGRKPTHVALCARCMEWRGWPRAAGWAPPSSPSAGSPGMSDRGGVEAQLGGSRSQATNAAVAPEGTCMYHPCSIDKTTRVLRWPDWNFESER